MTKDPPPAGPSDALKKMDKLELQALSLGIQLLHLEEMPTRNRRELITDVLHRSRYTGQSANTAYFLAQEFASGAEMDYLRMNRDRVMGVVIGIKPKLIENLTPTEKFAGLAARNLLMANLRKGLLGPTLTQTPADSDTALTNRVTLLAKLALAQGISGDQAGSEASPGVGTGRSFRPVMSIE